MKLFRKIHRLNMAFKHHTTAKQLFRYGIIGITTNAIGYYLYLLLTYAGLTPKVSMTLLYVVIATLNFFANRKITFSFKTGLLGPSAKYIFAQLLGYLMNLVILMLFVDRLGYPHQLVQIVAIFSVALFLFIALKFFVFTARA